MFGSKRPEWSLGEGVIPYKVCGWNNSQTTRYDCFHHCRLQVMLLNDSTSSGFQETYLHGTTIWQIPMDSITNGYSCGTRHFPIQTRCHLYWHERCDRNCWWHNHCRKRLNGTWQKFPSIYRKMYGNNLTLNSEKIQFKQSQVSFYGHIWSKHGISPDPKKIQALKHMEFPPDKETMRYFLSMINYLNRYSALSTHLAALLSALTHQATDYNPRKVHLENFQWLKMEISNMKALPYFNFNAETTLQMDASKKGLGACLIQNGKVICYASRVLTKTEQNYQNLEQEALGIIWGMEKFHYFLYGKEFTLETDQKPLVSIYHKHMVDINPRVQGLIIRSFPYLPFHVVYKKGKDISVTDALSQVTPMDPENNIQLPIIAVNMITTHILMSVHPQHTFSKKFDWLRKSTAQDNQLTRLSCYITTGFPCDKKNLPTDIQEFGTTGIHYQSKMVSLLVETGS